MASGDAIKRAIQNSNAQLCKDITTEVLKKIPALIQQTLDEALVTYEARILAEIGGLNMAEPEPDSKRTRLGSEAASSDQETKIEVSYGRVDCSTASSRSSGSPAASLLLFYMSDCLPQRDLCSVRTLDTKWCAGVDLPKTWQTRVLSLRHHSYTKSEQMINLLQAGGHSLKHILGLEFPGRIQPSKLVLQEIRRLCPQARIFSSAASFGLWIEKTWINFFEVFGTVLESLTHPASPRVKLVSLIPLDMQLTKLRHLDVDGFHLEGPGAWRRIPHVMPHIEVLRIQYHSLSRTTDGCLQYLLELTQLRELDLSSMWTLTDEGLHTLARLRALKSLHLRNMGPGISGRGLQELANGVEALRELDLSCCSSGCPILGPKRTQIGLADAAAFRARRPDVKLVFN